MPRSKPVPNWALELIMIFGTVDLVMSGVLGDWIGFTIWALLLAFSLPILFAQRRHVPAIEPASKDPNPRLARRS